MVVIAFDESGRVRSVEKFGQERGQDVAIVRRETPTAGNDLNLVQEFLGNIGRFNKNEAEAAAGNQCARLVAGWFSSAAPMLT